MTERIDHVAQAKSLAAYGTSPSTGSPEVGAMFVAEAQVHATLALVEQLRIANLIALDKTHEQYTVPADDEIGEEAYASTRLRTDIREGLGL
ncbi:hypothetical protein ACWKWN_08650 [Microbacterium trichothecenolyticum]